MPSIYKKDDNLPVGKEPGVNSPKLTSAFKRSGFFDNKVVSEYDINDVPFKSASEYQGDPIVPPTHKDITVETDLQHAYDEILTEMQSISKDCEYEENVMSLAEECSKLQKSIQAMKEKRKMVESFIDKIQSGRTKAKHAAKYWMKIDPVKYAQWLCIINASDRILSKVDETKEKAKAMTKVTIDVDKESSTLGNELSSDTFVESSDGNMVTVNEVLPAGLKATPKNRFSRKLRTTTTKRTAHDFVPIESYTLYLNGGRNGKRRKLHKEGLEWSDGKIRCKLCSCFIKQARCMEEHCATSKHIKSLGKKLKQKGSSFIKLL